MCFSHTRKERERERVSYIPRGIDRLHVNDILWCVFQSKRSSFGVIQPLRTSRNHCRFLWWWLELMLKQSPIYRPYFSKSVLVNADNMINIHEISALKYTYQYHNLVPSGCWNFNVTMSFYCISLIMTRCQCHHCTFTGAFIDCWSFGTMTTIIFIASKRNFSLCFVLHAFPINFGIFSDLMDQMWSW